MGLDSSPDPSTSAEQLVASPVATAVVADAQVATAATDVLRQMIAMEKQQQRKRPSVSSNNNNCSSPPNLELISDAELAMLCVFHVPDKALHLQDPNNRAFTSLPLNLTLKPSNVAVAKKRNELGVFSTDFIPRFARFGPLCGDCRMPLIFSSNNASHLLRLIETNSRKANWMKNVQMAENKEEQNLVACQVKNIFENIMYDNEIYFYTIRSIQPNTELLFWYSHEYAQHLRVEQRLNEENETELTQKEQQTTTDLMREKCSTPERLPASGGVSNCGSNLRKTNSLLIGSSNSQHSHHSPVASASSTSDLTPLFSDDFISINSSSESSSPTSPPPGHSHKGELQRHLTQSPSSLFAAVAAMLPQQNRQDNENTYNIRHQQQFPHQTPHIRRPPINNGLLTEMRSGDLINIGRSTATTNQTTSIQSTSIPPTEGISSSFAVAAELRQSLQAYQAALERPFTCTSCGRNYISPSGLRTHWKNTACRPLANELNYLQNYVDGLAGAGTGERYCPSTASNVRALSPSNMDMERQQEEYEENCSVNEEGLFMKGEIEEETSVGEDEEEIINVSEETSNKRSDMRECCNNAKDNIKSEDIVICE
uniref:SET domain-containing protein n=1 Tax=Meloidogyne javanica TaxID=6303 RepID=A0A915MXU3_MELJA